MVVRQPLFEQNDTTDQSAEVFRLLFQQFFTERSGIISETSFEVIQHASGADASVDIRSGSLIIAGTESVGQGYYHIVNDRDITLPRPAAPSSTLSRLDTIIVRVRDSVFPSGQLTSNVDDAVFEWVSGTPTSGTPVPPDLDALGYENYYKLANVNVPAGSPNTPTTSANITDIRVSGGANNRAAVIGGMMPCTSITRPSTPRHGQWIWEEDTKKFLINEGTTVANWVVYGVSNLSKWQNFSSGFPISGSGIVTWGRYIKLGNTVFGTTGFRFSNTGSGNLIGPVSCRVPVRAANPGVTGLVFIGGGRGFDSTGLLQGVFWSATATIVQNDLYLRSFATQGLPLWDTTHPFNWGSGTNFEKSDSIEMFFVYESET